MTAHKDKIKKANTSQKVSREGIISRYVETVLTRDSIPTSVYKFCKDNGFKEEEFYSCFGSIEGIQEEIWNSFYNQTVELAQKSEAFHTYSNREKMLTFFYTFFEVLTLNRSYVLFSLREKSDLLKNLKQLKGLRTRVKNFTSELIKEQNDEQNLKILKRPVTVFAEGAWLQTLFLLKYWLDDNSANFENTDIAIEKSVRAIFDLFDNTPMESIIDFGKFLWKERMS